MYLHITVRKKAVAILALLLAACITYAFVHPALRYKQAAAYNAPTVAVPIIMYHGLLKDPDLQGQYVISPDLFESDIQYLVNNGYTTIVMQDLINYVYNGGELPEKPVMITFDDGYYNNYLYAYPILQKYQCKMVFSPIGRYADQYSQTPDTHASFAHASWDMIKEMCDSGLVEVQNHSYNMHSNTNGRQGSKKNKNESLEDYKRIFTNDVNKAQQAITENTGYTPTTFTYPFGAISDVSVDILKEQGFLATLSCENKMNYLPRDPEALFGLKRFLRPGGLTSEQYFAKILS